MLTFCLQVDCRRRALSAAHLAGWDVDGNACGALLALLIKAAAAAA
jgi:hypothetical protein